MVFPRDLFSAFYCLTYIFLNGVFYFIQDISIANYADDNSTYATENNPANFLNTLEKETSVPIERFKVNEMKPNEDKCYLLVANCREGESVKPGNEIIVTSPSVDLLGVKIVEKLNFKEHVTRLCKKGNRKLHALAPISKFPTKDKLKILMKTFIIS